MQRTERSPRCFFTADVVCGLVPVAVNELRQRFGRRVRLVAIDEAGTIEFQYQGEWQALQGMRTVTAIYFCCRYPIPRPKALLGHQHLHRLLAQIETVRQQRPSGDFRSFRISAAGRDSAVFRRLQRAIAEQTGLLHDDEDGELLLRIRPVPHGQGWEVLCRLTPRPLSVRTWRVRDVPGALDATVAAAMIRLSKPKTTDRFLNLMSGSGTLLVERLAHGTATRVTGCEIDSDILCAAHLNLAAAGVAHRVELLQEDVTRLPFAAGSFDVLMADLPWGHLVGSHANNQILYPQTLREAARVAEPGARLVIITHEVQLMEQVLHQQGHRWQLHATLRLQRGHLHPRIYLLQRR